MALHPAVLRLIDQAVKGAGRYGKWVGVCGGIGSDPQAIPILIGLGVKELSVSVSMIPTIKAQVRSLDLDHCQKLAAQALAWKPPPKSVPWCLWRSRGEVIPVGWALSTLSLG
jgi:phosphoenolpyruvate-protein kinase (PTS system EI component)